MIIAYLFFHSITAMITAIRTVNTINPVTPPATAPTFVPPPPPPPSVVLSVGRFLSPKRVGTDVLVMMTVSDFEGDTPSFGTDVVGLTEELVSTERKTYIC